MGPRPSRALPGFLLAVIVVVAGCSGPLGSNRRATGGGTLTPAPVPETTATPGTGFAPGLTAEGVTDPVRLANAHARVLATASFATRRNVTRRHLDGSVASRTTRTVLLSADKRRFRYVLDWRVADRSYHVERYANGRRVYEATTTPEGTRYAVVRSAAGEPLGPGALFRSNATNRRGIAELFGRVDLRVTGRHVEDGTTLYRLSTPRPQDVRPVRDIRMTATVSERGVVRGYHLTYRVRRDGTPTRVTVDVAFTGVGTTTVSRPGWYDEARNATGETRNATAA